MSPSIEVNDSSSANQPEGWLKYVYIGVATAVSGMLIKLFELSGEENLIIGTIVHTLIVLIPAAITYFLLSRDQEKRLVQVINNLDRVSSELMGLKRVMEIEKNYFANERLLNLERRVIDETGSSMQEVAELVSAFDDGDMLHVKLKERFRTHAKSILTFHRTFSVEIEDNLRSISQVENEFSVIPHDERDQLVYDSGKQRTEKVYLRHNINQVVESVERLTQQQSEMASLADKTHKEIVETLDNPKTSDGE